MKRVKESQLPPRLAYTLLAGLTVILLLLPLHAFFSTWGGAAIGPLWLWKAWKEVLLLAMLGLTIGWMARQPGLLRRASRHPVIIVLALYVGLTIVMGALLWPRNGIEATLVGIAMNLRYLGIGFVAYVLFRHYRFTRPWLPAAGWSMICAGTMVALLGILQVLILPNDALRMFGYGPDTIDPATFLDNNPDLPRAFATLRGPNDFAAYLILPIILVLGLIRRLPVWVSVSTIGLLLGALLLSGSRSAWLGLLAAVGVLVAFGAARRLRRRRIILSAVGLGLVVTALAYAAVTVPAVRLAVFHSSPGDSSLTEGSTDKHLDATLTGLARIVENPIGCGPGCAGPASYYGPTPRISENYFIQLAEETGVLGLGLFLTLMSAIVVGLFRARQPPRLGRALLASLAGYAVIGLLLHVWADDPLSMTWWLLTGAVIGYNENVSWTFSKNNSPSKRSSSSSSSS